MKANDYQNKIDEMTGQVQGNIVALLKKHNVTKLDFNTILDECKTTKSVVCLARVTAYER